MAEPLVTLEELQARPGFGEVDPDQAEATLADASALVRLAAEGELDDVVPPDVPGAVRAVVVSMARRGLTNPRGLTQESLGDYSYSSGGQQATTLYLTRRERQIIRRAAGVLGAATVQLKGYLPLRDGVATRDLTGSL